MVGYFTLAIKNGTYTLSAYLIAQEGKNFRYGANERITGEQLFQAAVDTIKELQYMARGMVIFLETEDNDKLMHFYEDENGFKRFDAKKVGTGTENGHILVQLLKIL